MDKIYAQILNGLVENIIVLNDDHAEYLYIFGPRAGFDDLVRVDILTPIPQIGWSYDGVSFTPPPLLDT